MPENTTPTPPPANPPNAAAAPASRPDAGHIPITEEMDSAKWTLPPIVPLLIAGVFVAILVAVVVFTNRSTPVASLAITKVAAADQQGNTMVAVQAKLDNQIDKLLYVKAIVAEIETADGKKLSDTAAPSMDAARYIEAFPPLQEAKADPLKEELKLPAKTAYSGVAVFAFPIDKKTFDSRKGLTLRVQMYDNPTLVAKETPPKP
jgi:lipopolysaccharide export LptBFGC system permease protein LptF